MPRQIPDYLRLHVEENASATETAVPQCDDFARAFVVATGWEIWRSPGEPGGYQLESAGHPKLSEHEARQLCDAYFTAEAATRRLESALTHREAQLAAAVPVVSRRDEASHLSQRLEAILAAACQTSGADAAGLYVLDDTTTELKLRAGCNLGTGALLHEARPLRTALAELEALVGHAVVIENTTSGGIWNTPLPCQAAVCVPVSTPSTPLGVLWVFSRLQRQFSESVVNTLEIIAGRLASELEREVLLSQAAGKLSQSDAEVLEAWRAGTQITLPDDEAWEMGGQKNDPHGKQGHALFSFAARRHTMLCLVQPIGPFGENLIAATLAQSAFTILAEQESDPEVLMEKVQAVLWQSNALCPAINIACARLDSHRHKLTAAVSDGGCLVGGNGSIKEIWADEPRTVELDLTDDAPLALSLIRHDRVSPMDVATSLTATLRNGADLAAKPLASALENCLSLRLDNASKYVGPVVVLRRKS